ncbi:MAG: hypothetical protein ABW104_13800 [Candidatus Thiodiazotropha sp. 6PLUC2]
MDPDGDTVRIYRCILIPATPVTEDIWLIFELIDEEINQEIEIGRRRLGHLSPPLILLLDKDHRDCVQMPLLITPGYQLKVSIESDTDKTLDEVFTLYIEARTI